MAAILDFPIGTILAIFDLQITPMLPSKFQVNWPFGSGEEAKTIAAAAISEFRSEYKLFATSHRDASYQVSSQLAFWFRRKKRKNDFMMAATAAILDFGSELFSYF